MFPIPRQFTLLVLLFSVLIFSVNAACNGFDQLCSKKYSNVTYVGAHDSYAADGTLSSNQDYDVTVQLNDGIRMLQTQVHLKNGQLHLCHTSCTLLDAGTLQDYLGKVKSWLDANPNEVISILIVNSDNQSPATFDASYKAAGLDTYSYSPSTTGTQAWSDWPTLQEMINDGKRVVSYLASGADTSSVSYLLDEFSYMWEGKYDITDTSNFNCAVDRNGGSGDTSNKMYLINHYLDKSTAIGDVPDKNSAANTNGVSGTGSLGAEAELCGSMYGTYPTFMLVDFYDRGGGSVFQVADTLNDVPYTSTAMGAGATSSSSDFVDSVKSDAGLNFSRVTYTCILLSLTTCILVSLIYDWL